MELGAYHISYFAVLSAAVSGSVLVAFYDYRRRRRAAEAFGLRVRPNERRPATTEALARRTGTPENAASRPNPAPATPETPRTNPAPATIETLEHRTRAAEIPASRPNPAPALKAPVCVGQLANLPYTAGVTSPILPIAKMLPVPRPNPIPLRAQTRGLLTTCWHVPAS